MVPRGCKVALGPKVTGEMTDKSPVIGRCMRSCTSCSQHQCPLQHLQCVTLREICSSRDLSSSLPFNSMPMES